MKRFFAEDMRRALLQVKETLGPDAVIMSNKKVNGGVEIVAAIDGDAESPAAPQSAPTPAPETESTPANSLAEILARQAESQAAPSQPQQTYSEPEPQVTTSASDEPSWQEPEPDNHIPDYVGGGSASEIAELKSQIKGIQNLLQHQLSGLMKQEIEREEPMRALLVKRLMTMGISERIADQIACFIPEGDDIEDSWEQALQLLEGQLNTTHDDILTRGGAVALVGPTGVGKTTTIAKLAARYAQRHGSDSVALITTDTFRIGASEQLKVYGRIIGCPVKIANDAKELADAMLSLRDKRLILIDTAGMGQRDKRLSEQLGQILQNKRLRIRPYLVLSATAQTQVLNDTVKQFKTLPLAGCIFTKLDECLSLGESISVAIEQGLAVGYLTHGQQVPEDIRVADEHYMVTEAERLYDKSICSNVSDMPKSSWQAVQ